MAIKAVPKNVDLDLATETLPQDLTGMSISQSLSVKGFCVIRPAVDEAHLKGVQSDITAVDAEGRFMQPPEPLLEGLLGISGSARIAELQLPLGDAERQDGEHLQFFDVAMTDYGQMVAPYLLDIQAEVKRRTIGILHEAGMPPGEGPELDEQTCANWITVFAHNTIMLVWCLGPEEGTLELQPFDDESNGHRVTLKPGMMVMLRADALSHRFSSAGKVYCLTCFFQKESLLCKHRDNTRTDMTPCCKALEEWAENKIQEYKESFPEEQARMYLPRHWELVMNHTSFVGQHISVRTASIKQVGSYDPTIWAEAFTAGVDYIEQVPIMRWNIEDNYDPHEEAWKYNRSNCKHGAFIDGVELFDNTLFRISRAEAGGMDPGHRLTLETGYEALIRDGYKISTIMNSRGGVYVANPPPTEWGIADKDCNSSGVCGGGGSIACGRFSFVHGMKGPCISVDVEAASSLVAVNFCSTNLSRSGNWEPIPYGLAQSWNLVLAPMFFVHASAAGRLCPAGRLFSFDASANGFVRGECAISLLLKALTSVVDDEVVCNYTGGWLGSLVANATNQSGRRAKMHSPDAAALQEVMFEAVRQAEISPLDVDAVETAVDAYVLHDALEASATAKAMRPEGMPGIDETCPLAMASTKTSIGNQIEACGLSVILKVLLGSALGTMVPSLHLRILNPHLDLDCCDRPASIGTESLEYRLSSSYTGITNSSVAGTNCHCIVWGQMADEKRTIMPEIAFKRDKILFWPEGGGHLEDGKVARRGYFIIGTFNGWQPEALETESPGVFASTFTLSENRWERFQIVLDQDVKKVLYPSLDRISEATTGAPVAGPLDVFRNSSWLIDTRPYLTFEASPEDDSRDALVPYAGNVSRQDFGQPGDRFRVRLSVKGKWRMVEWENLDKGRLEAPAVARGTGTYQVAGSWSHSSLEEMQPVPDTQGLFAAEVMLLSWGVSTFQIFRNRDWEQAFYPDVPLADQGSGVIGPDEQIGHAWAIDGGIPGQVYRIEFQRSEEDGAEQKQVQWKYERKVELTKAQVEMSKVPEFFVHGTWDDLASLHRMHFTGEYYQFYVQLGDRAIESFQIYQDGDVAKCIHPGVKDATAHEKHELLGPDMVSAGLMWTIGIHAGDEAEAGKRYEIRFRIKEEDQRPEKLDWMPIRGFEGLEDARGRGFLVLGQ